MVKKLLLEIVRYPRRFDHILGLPQQFDAAEALLDYWEKLSNKEQELVTEVLVASGKYTDNAQTEA